MPIEIHIVSGSQQGRRMRFDGDRVVVGDGPTADMRFDPDREPHVRGKSAVLTLDSNEGWQILNVGQGVWLVNQATVDRTQSLRLRSDDLIRVSEIGPDFSFRIVAGPRGCAIPATTQPSKERRGGKTVATGPSPVPPLAASGSTEKKAAMPGVLPAEPGEQEATDASPPTLPETAPCEAIVKDSVSGLLGRLGAMVLRSFRPKSAASDAPDAPAKFMSAPTPVWAETTRSPDDERHGAILSPGNSPEDRPLTASPSCGDQCRSTIRGGEEPTPEEFAQALPKRRKLREAGLLVRVIGLAVSGMLGVVCAYAIACWVNPKNDRWHVFHKQKTTPRATGLDAARTPSPLAPSMTEPAPSVPRSTPSPPAPSATMRMVEGERRVTPEITIDPSPDEAAAAVKPSPQEHPR